MAERHLTYGPGTGPCAVCGKDGARACSRCRVDFYCNKEHQLADWERHRLQSCGSIKLRVDQRPGGLGRHLVAVRDIPAGSVLMRELPLLVFPDIGPLMTFSGELPCVGCCRSLTNVQKCPRCGWPVCSTECSQREEHRAECTAFQRANFKMKENDLTKLDLVQMHALVALRVCLAWRAEGQGKEVADRLRNLQSSLPDIQDVVANVEGFRSMVEHAYHVSQSRASASAKWLRETVGVNWLPEDELTHALHAALLNAVDAAWDEDMLEGGLYAGVSMVEHACAGNVSFHPCSKERPERVLRTLRDIAKGEHITLSYQDNLFGGTEVRRLELLWRGFVCQCELCRDPTEKGLHMASWCCGYCNRLGRQRFVYAGDWALSRCGACGYVWEGIEDETGGRKEVTQLERALDQLVQANEERGSLPASMWKNFVAGSVWPRGPLHPTHCLVLRAKMTAIGMSPHESGPVVHPGSVDESETLEGYCDDLLSVMDKLYPGPSQLRYELLSRRCLLALDHFTIASLGLTECIGHRRKFSKKIEDLKAIRTTLAELKKKLVAAAVGMSKKELQSILKQIAEFESIPL